jgi:hypothetical protein
MLAARGLFWLIPAIALANLGSLTLATFCATDPPAIPTFTSAETNAILKLQFGSDFDSGISKFRDLLLNLIWYDTCKCDVGSPTPFVPPSPPTGTPIVQNPVGQVGAPCSTGGSTRPLVAGNNPFIGFLDGTGKQVTSTFITFTNTTTTAPGVTVTVGIQKEQPSAPLSPSTITSYTIAPGATITQNLPFDPALPVIAVSVNSVTGTGACSFAWTGQMFCNGQVPGVSASPCCPPDPSTQSYLDLILQTVTLIQRQNVPFAYVLSTVHSGLSGAGSISISGLLGCKVQLTSLPSNIGQAGTSPAELFEVGFVTFGTPDGYPSSYRIEHNPEVILPVRCSAFTTLAFDFSPGVVATITEILREP